MGAKTFLLTAKWMFLLVVFSLGAVGAQAQGVLNFATAAGGAGGSVNAPATNYTTFPASRPAGAIAFAQLYVGPAGTIDPTLLTTNGVGGGPAIFNTGAQAGYITAGPRVIDGYAPGTTITVQLRAWSGIFATWEEAFPFYSTAVSGIFAPNLIQVTLGDGVGTTPNLVGIQPYFIGGIPEPATWTLLLLGGTVFVLRLRRRRR